MDCIYNFKLKLLSKTSISTDLTLLKTRLMLSFLTLMQTGPLSTFLEFHVKWTFAYFFWVSSKQDLCLFFLTLTQTGRLSTFLDYHANWTIVYFSWISCKLDYCLLLLTLMQTRPLVGKGVVCVSRKPDLCLFFYSHTNWIFVYLSWLSCKLNHCLLLLTLMQTGPLPTSLESHASRTLAYFFYSHTNWTFVYFPWLSCRQDLCLFFITIMQSGPLTIYCLSNRQIFALNNLEKTTNH